MTKSNDNSEDPKPIDFEASKGAMGEWIRFHDQATVINATYREQAEAALLCLIQSGNRRAVMLHQGGK